MLDFFKNLNLTLDEPYQNRSTIFLLNPVTAHCQHFNGEGTDES